MYIPRTSQLIFSRGVESPGPMNHCSHDHMWEVGLLWVLGLAGDYVLLWSTGSHQPGEACA